ncbi:MAG: hypothetical protein RL141_385 [Candidatus Parcubacteria bacterium]|jgi:16S rRNA (adenine1518-N6/adenine1519-N6)-dimethyltransferase
MNAPEIKQVLATLGARPNKQLGQHFLIDDAALDAMIQASGVRPGDHVLEIGPGLGVLTDALLQAGASVTAIEQDRLFIPYLERRFSGLPLRVAHGDAASLSWEQVVDTLEPWKCISNLPYAITSLALRKALWSPHPAERVTVLVQREVAERAVAKNGKTSLLSLMVSLASSEAHIVRRVPAGAFFPPPKVESAVLEIISLPLHEREARWGIDPEHIMHVAKTGFAHPRKHLAANLATPAHPKAALQELFSSLSINPLARAENLSPIQWAALTRAQHPRL